MQTWLDRAPEIRSHSTGEKKSKGRNRPFELQLLKKKDLMYSFQKHRVDSCSK